MVSSHGNGENHTSQPGRGGELAGHAEPVRIAPGDPDRGAAQLGRDDLHLAADHVGVEVLPAAPPPGENPVS